MCKFLKDLFKGNPKIPYPEEKPDYSITMGNYDTVSVVYKWLMDYQVPLEFHGYWRTQIDIQVYDEYPQFILNMGVTDDNPALAWGDLQGRHLALHPEYLNAGIIAHENAHNSYSLLTEDQKKEFASYFNLYAYDIYFIYKENDELLNYLLKEKRASIHGNVIEAHADIYRFLGIYLPEKLKKFYPKLYQSGV